MTENLSSIVESSEAEQLATGFVFTEGPLWHPDGYLLFVDIRQALILKLVPGGNAETFRDNSGESNGLTFDLQGRLVMCEGGNRQITRMEADGTITPLAASWEGKRARHWACRVDRVIRARSASAGFPTMDDNPRAGAWGSDQKRHAANVTLAAVGRGVAPRRA